MPISSFHGTKHVIGVEFQNMSYEPEFVFPAKYDPLSFRFYQGKDNSYTIFKNMQQISIPGRNF